MNEKLIDNTIRDYSLRELQIYSSKILSVCGATNSFIKQFKADNDSHQFYKNVIKWYVKKYRKFPEDKLLAFIFKFLVNDTGLGDKFIMVSNILYTMKDLNIYNHFIVELFGGENRSTQDPAEWLNFTDFYGIIDFFHFERPSTQVPIITKVKNKESIDVHANIMLTKNITALRSKKKAVSKIFKKRKNITGNVYCLDYNMKNEIYGYHNRHLYDHGKYWPIKYDKTVKKTIIAFMFYVDLGSESGSDGIDSDNKFITLEEEKSFNELKNYLKQYLHRSEYYFVRLEDVNYAKNVELLSRSKLLIASEGMWTHLSRAMNIDTIAYTNLPEFIEEFNNQGHFCSGNFEECLTKLKEKCTNSTK